MAIANDKLQKFFSNQKVGVFDALKQKGKFNLISDPGTKRDSPAVENKQTSVNISTQNNVLPSLEKHLQIKTEDHHNSRSLLSEQNIPLNSTSKHSVSSPLSLREQSVSEPLAVREQSSSDPLAIRKQSVSDPFSVPLANESILTRSNELNRTNLNVYSKKERELLNLIFWKCHEEFSLTSPVITTDEIRQALQISPERVRNLIFRISKKGDLVSKMYKSGQNACRIFEFTMNCYQALSADNTKQAKKGNIPLAEPLANTSSSSSNNIKTTTDLPLDWKKINIEPLKDIGFSENQLKQLLNLNVPEIVQESINHFAFALEYNEKYKSHQNPLNLIMGVLRKGRPWFESAYQSPQEIAQREFLERKQAERERLKRLEEDVYKLAFDEWRETITPEQKNEIAPVKKDLMDMTPPHVKLSLYFKEHVWPMKKKDYLVNI